MGRTIRTRLKEAGQSPRGEWQANGQQHSSETRPPRPSRPQLGPKSQSPHLLPGVLARGGSGGNPVPHAPLQPRGRFPGGLPVAEQRAQCRVLRHPLARPRMDVHASQGLMKKPSLRGAKKSARRVAQGPEVIWSSSPLTFPKHISSCSPHPTHRSFSCSNSRGALGIRPRFQRTRIRPPAASRCRQGTRG